MIHITDSMIDGAVSATQAQDALREAFRSFAEGNAAMQERIRTECGGTKISTMAAVLPQQKFAGAKVYTTIEGRFSFVIVLFSADTGLPLASVEANAITRLRTAACSVLASRHLARANVRRLSIFGAGVQGRAHAAQFSAAYPLEEIRICDPFAAAGTAERLRDECGVPVRMAKPQDMLEGADLVVTASRSATPLFAGADLPPGCFVAAIGSSLPHTRELDDVALTRAARIAVDWGPQTRREAGDLVQAGPETGVEGKIVEFADLIAGRAEGRKDDSEITIYKAVGVALQDIAIAGLAYERISAR
jgi:ornithine cyclodeaminase